MVIELYSFFARCRINVCLILKLFIHIKQSILEFNANVLDIIKKLLDACGKETREVILINLM